MQPAGCRKRPADCIHPAVRAAAAGPCTARSNVGITELVGHCVMPAVADEAQLGLAGKAAVPSKRLHVMKQCCFVSCCAGGWMRCGADAPAPPLAAGGPSPAPLGQLLLHHAGCLRLLACWLPGYCCWRNISHCCFICCLWLRPGPKRAGPGGRALLWSNTAAVLAARRVLFSGLPVGPLVCFGFV